MHILLTGVTGYIGRRLLNSLLDEGHSLTCCVRNRKRAGFLNEFGNNVQVIETDFSTPIDLDSLEVNTVDAAYFLIHSLKSNLE